MLHKHWRLYGMWFCISWGSGVDTFLLQLQAASIEVNTFICENSFSFNRPRPRISDTTISVARLLQIAMIWLCKMPATDQRISLPLHWQDFEGC
jgi:hypothetical protein